MTEAERVLRLVENTKAIQWWIDKQITDGKTNEEIEKLLPYAVAFITNGPGATRFMEGT